MNESVRVRFESEALHDQRAELFELTGREELSKLFEYEIRIACADAAGLDEREVLASPAALVFERDGHETRRVFGVVSSVTDTLLTETDHAAYRLTFVPRAHRLSLAETSEVFMEQSVPDVIRTKLERAGFGAQDQAFRLVASYPKREYVVQYRETDLQFISRLAEHVGITFWFEHEGGRDVLVFGDANSGFRVPVGLGPVPFHRRGERAGVFALESATRRLPKRYVVRDYNYRTPDVYLLASAEISRDGEGDVIEYGAHFKTQEEGQWIANVRAEEVRATGRVVSGESVVEALGAGTRFVLEGHPRADGELLVLHVDHRARQTVFGSGTGGDTGYRNTFRAIPFKTTFRPPRVTPKPRVHGTITGVVESAQEGQYAELDGEGRYHVRSLFDMADAPQGKASRAMRMAQPHAGAGYGFHFPLRDGVEVILTCIDGDPDRPIIAGAVPNPVTPSTVGAKNATRNVIRTGGGNEINIDDTEGSERIKMSTPFGGTVLQLGAPNAPTAGALIETGNDVDLIAKGNISELAEGEITHSAGTNLNQSAPWIDVAGENKIRQGAPVIELNGGATIDAGADVVKIVGRAFLTGESPVVLLKGGATITLSAGAFVCINAGAGVMVNAGGKVSVSAPMVEVNGSGEVNIKGGTIKLNT